MIRHSFRNISEATAFSECFDVLRDGVFEQLALDRQDASYYYKPWYASFVAHLQDDALPEFLTYMLFETSRELDAQMDERKMERRTALSAKAKLEAHVRSLSAKVDSLESDCGRLESENCELSRKFSKVEWLYLVGRRVLAPVRALLKRRDAK